MTLKNDMIYHLHIDLNFLNANTMDMLEKKFGFELPFREKTSSY